jgi:Membrane-associating domain
VAELASAAVSQCGYLNSSTSVNHDSLKIIVGIVGHFLNHYEDNNAYPNVRLVYTEVVAALSMLCSILWMVFWTTKSYNIGGDLFISLAWFAAFGSLIEYVDCHHCTTSPFNIHYRNKIGGGLCKEWRVAEELAFIMEILFLHTITTYAEFFSKRRSTNSSPGIVEGSTVTDDVQ